MRACASPAGGSRSSSRRSPPAQGVSRAVHRYDLGTGRALQAPVGPKVSLVISGAGGVAWIQAGAVRALTTSGLRILDAGPVAPRSLKRAGRAGVSWVRDGTRHTARVS